MDSLEVNKAIAAILVAGIAFMVSGFIGEIIVHRGELKKPAIEIAGVPAEGGAAAQAQAPKAPPILPLLASADTAKGQQVANTDCSICHTFNQGGGPKVGPNLYGIVGAKRAHERGFSYSEGVQKLGGTWTYENLNQWLFDPHTVVPDTRMAFAGIKNNKDRADVIAWLRTLSPNPEPLPSAEDIKAAEAEAQKAAASPPAAETKAVPVGPAQPGFDAVLAKADPAKGKADADTVCGICHSFEKGQPPKIGPNLYGIVGAKRAHEAGFDYSAGLKKLDGTWTYDELNKWLANPMGVVPDTRMVFPGVKSEKERADIVAYLRSLSDHPEPLPTAAAPAAQPAPAATAATPAEQPAAPTAQAPAAEQPAAPAAGQPTAPTAQAPASEQPAAPAAQAPAAEQPAPAAQAPAAEQPAAPAAQAPVAEQQAGQPAAPRPGFDALLAKADPEKGKTDAETVCGICHSFGKGEPAKIGPNLYGVVGAPRAHVPGFDYSAGLKKLGGDWTYDELNQWLANPMGMVPDTKMMFPGVKSEKERADIVAWLRTLSDHAEPLPQAAATEGGQSGAAKPAEAPATAGTAQGSQESGAPAAEAPSGNQAAPAAGATTQGTPAGAAQGSQESGAPAAEAPSGNQAAPAAGATTQGTPAGAAQRSPKEAVTPAPEAPSGEQAAPTAGGASQETPAEKASPGGAGTLGPQPQAGAPGAPTPALEKP